MLTRLLAHALLLGTAALALLAVGVVVFALVAGRPRMALRTAVAAGAWLACYALLVAASPLLQRRVVLAPGEERELCGFDCHLKLAVVSVHARPAGADTTEWRVRLRARSDARRTPEFPSELVVLARDGGGTLRPPVGGGMAAAFGSRVLPGEVHTGDLVYRLPASAGRPTLVAHWRGRLASVMAFGENARAQRRIEMALGDTGTVETLP